MRPMINFLMLLSSVIPFSWHNFGFSIIILTVILAVLMEPFYRRQLRSTKRMRELQPKLKELQKKYAKNKEGLAQAQWQLYREHGVNPIGCTGPMLIQMPIWIAMYRAVMECLAYAPENMFGLSKQLYSLSILHETIPLNNQFIWLDLGHGDAFLAIAVAVTMWVQMKMSQTTTATDPQQQQIQGMMQWLMPLMLGYFTWVFPSGLGLYWFVNNLLRVGMQYRIDGWGGLSGFSLKESLSGLMPGRGGAETSTVVVSKPSGKGGSKKGTPRVSKEDTTPVESEEQEQEDTGGGETTPKRRKVSDGRNRDKRKVRRRGRRPRSS